MFVERIVIKRKNLPKRYKDLEWNFLLTIKWMRSVKMADFDFAWARLIFKILVIYKF